MFVGYGKKFLRWIISRKTEPYYKDTDKKNFTVAMVTDVGGVDDKSFNQSAWEGLERWGKDNNVTKGNKGYDYFQSKTAADFQTSFNQAVSQKFSMIAGIGYSLHDATVNTAKKNPNTKFVLIDERYQAL